MKKKFSIGPTVTPVDPPEPEAIVSFRTTTSGPQTLTINELTVSASTTVDWGDGSTNAYTGSGSRTHNYATAGVFDVKILQPENVTALTLNSTGTPIALKTEGLAPMVNMVTFRADNLPAGSGCIFNSEDLKDWNPTSFQWYAMPSGSLFVFLFSASSFSSWAAVTTFRMDDNLLTQAQVDDILIGLNSAGPIRTGTAGTITLGGTNAGPSGEFQKEAVPTTGKTALHNLMNNSNGTMLSARVWDQAVITNGTGPASVPGIALWVDADDASTLYKNDGLSTPATLDGDTIGGMRDKSLKSRELKQATSANRPTLQLAELNGKSVIRFDGTNDHLYNSFGNLSQPYSMAVVAKVNAGAASATLVGSYSSANSLFIGSGSSGNAIINAGTSVSNSGSYRGDFHVYSAVFDGANSVIRVDNIPSVIANAGTGSLTGGAQIGATNGATLPASADIAEVLIYDVALTEEQLQAVEGYLSAKWNVPLVVNPPTTDSGYITSAAALTYIRDQAALGVQPYAARTSEFKNGSNTATYWPSNYLAGPYIWNSGSTVYARINGVDYPEHFVRQQSGAQLTYRKAIMYHLTGDTSWAQNVRDKIVEVSTTGHFGGEVYNGANECILHLSRALPLWIQAADLIDGSPVFSAGDRAAFEDWLADTCYKKTCSMSYSKRNNWGSAGSLASAMIADYVGPSRVLTEVSPVARTVTGAEAFANANAQQVLRMNTVWNGGSSCSIWGIQPHGGIPDELRRGPTGCNGTYLLSGDTSARDYTITTVEEFIFHAEFLHNRGDDSLYDNVEGGGGGSLLKAIRFVVDNPSGTATSPAWDSYKAGSLCVANSYYENAAIEAAIYTGGLQRGYVCSFGMFTHMRN